MELKTTIDPDILNRFIFFHKRYVHRSQTQAAKILDIAQSNLSKLEAGKKEIRLDLTKNFRRSTNRISSG
jgi:hypothetical protein